MADDCPESGEGRAQEQRQPEDAGLPLARRPDFRLADAIVRPSIRTIEGPAGSAIAEPRVMQVLLAFVDAAGAVLTREDLMRRCWNGVVVGDDSVNRAIAEVRRIARNTEAGFAIETIPRIGYRLEGAAAPIGEPEAQSAATDARAAPKRFSRRWLVGGGATAVAVTALGVWAFLRRPDPRYAELIEQGRQNLRYGTSESGLRARTLFREAAAIEPDRAEAWGWLAASLHRTIVEGPTSGTPAITEACEEAAKRALALDPNDTNARVALAMLRRSLDDWVTYEDQARTLLADAPGNIGLLSFLGGFLQGVGRCRDSSVINEQAVRMEPLSPSFQHRRALKHWIFGRTAEADRVIDRARTLWPHHPLVWNSRLIIYAFTDRPQAARAMLDDADSRPNLEPLAIQTWHSVLRAIETRSRADVDAARASALAAAPQAPGIAANAVMSLSLLGEIDAAYVIAEGFLMQRGRLVGQPVSDAGERLLYGARGWRATQWLFTPATAPFRADDRFPAFCEGIGYSAYWRRRGIWPDDFVRGALRP